MKIAYITSRFPFGSGEAFLIEEVNALSNFLELFVVPMTLESRHQIHPNSAAHTVASPLLSLEIAVAAIREWANHPRETANIIGRVFAADPRLKIRLKNAAVIPKGLWLGRKLKGWGIQHIHAHWASTSSTLAWVASQVSGIPWSFTSHRWDLVEGNALRDKLLSCRFARVISNAGAATLIQFAPSARVIVVRMGVAIPAKASPQVKRHSLRLLVPANLLPVKGHKYLIAALARLEREHIVESCLIAGEGPERKHLEALCEKLGVNKVTRFMGAVPRRQVLRMYEDGAIDVVVLPSTRLADGTQEGVPTALMEAMAYAIPVVSTKSGAIAELVDGVGILVEPADVGALEEAIRSMLDPTVRTRLGLEGRQRVARDFNVDAVALQISTLLKETGAALSGGPP